MVPEKSGLMKQLENVDTILEPWTSEKVIKFIEDCWKEKPKNSFDNWIDAMYSQMSPRTYVLFQELMKEEIKKSTIKPWHVKKIKITNNKRRK